MERAIALPRARDFAPWLQDMWAPRVRLGVTGFARVGKTVFVTALVRNLVEGGWLGFFDPVAEGRLLEAHLVPGDPRVDLFDYGAHLAALTGSPPEWPARTTTVSQLRIALSYRSNTPARNLLGARTLELEIVDYPGEWLLDLPLLEMDFAAWSREALAAAEAPARRTLSRPWREAVAALDPAAPHDEEAMRKGAKLFRDYLCTWRDKVRGATTLTPGRFLEPGSEAGKPLMHFMPLRPPHPHDPKPPPGSLWREAERRYDAYCAELVRPFFADHFARLDRQVVLVDLLEALTHGPQAVRDLEEGLARVLAAFRHGSNSWLGRIFAPRIDRILFAATKADHIHPSGYERLKAIMNELMARVLARVRHQGAEVSVEALAAVRATRRATVRVDGQQLACIAGVPMAGEMIDGHLYDGQREAVVFPGALPDDPKRALAAPQDICAVRFRPPDARSNQDSDGNASNDYQPRALPHIRLDRALQFLLADRMK